MDSSPYKDKLPSFFRRRAPVAPLLAFERNERFQSISYLRSLNSVNRELSIILQSMPSEELKSEELSALLGSTIFAVKSICERTQVPMPRFEYEQEALRMSLEDFRSAFAPFLQEKMYQEVKAVEHDLRLWKHFSFKSPTSLIHFVFSAFRSYANISKEHFPGEKFTEFLVQTKQQWKDRFEVDQEYSSDEEGDLSNQSQCQNCMSLHSQLDKTEMKYIADCESYQNTVNELKENLTRLEEKTPKNDTPLGEMYEKYFKCVVKDIENLLDCEIMTFESDPANILPKVWMQIRAVIANAGKQARSKKNNICTGHLYSASETDLKNILFEIKSVLESLTDRRVFKLNIGDDSITVQVNSDSSKVLQKKIDLHRACEFDLILFDIKNNIEKIQTEEFRDFETNLEPIPTSKAVVSAKNTNFNTNETHEHLPSKDATRNDINADESGLPAESYIEEVNNLREEISALKQQLDLKEAELKATLSTSKTVDLANVQKELKSLRKSLKQIDTVEFPYAEPTKLKLQIDDILVMESDLEHKSKLKIKKLERENRVLCEKLEAISRSTSCGFSESQASDQSVDCLVAELRAKEDELKNAENPLEIHRDILALQTKISAFRTNNVVEKNQSQSSRLKKSFEKLEEEMISRDRRQKILASKLSINPGRIYPSANKEIEQLRKQLHLCIQENKKLKEEMKEMTDAFKINQRLEKAKAKEAAAQRLTSILDVQEEQLKNETLKVLRKDREIEEERKKIKELEISTLEKIQELDEREKEIEHREKTIDQPLLDDREFASMYSKIKNSVRILKEENERFHLEICRFEKEKAMIYAQKEKIISIWPKINQIIDIFG